MTPGWVFAESLRSLRESLKFSPGEEAEAEARVRALVGPDGRQLIETGPRVGATVTVRRPRRYAT